MISHNFPPESNAPAVRTYENARRWVQEGHAVTVITGPPNFPTGILQPGYRNRWLEREKMDGIRVLRTWMYLAPNQGFGPRILNYLSFMFTAVFASFFAPRSDVVIGTSPQLLVAVAAWGIATLRRRPFVFEVRDLWPESIVAVGAMRDGPLLAVLHRIARFLYRRAARIVVVTDAFRRVLESYGVAARRIAVVTNGVDIAAFRPHDRSPALRRSLGLDQRFVVSFVGTLGMAHGLRTVVEAAEQLRDHDRIRFLVVGEGADRDWIAQEIGRRDLRNILLLHAQPHDRVPELLAASDACLVLLRKAALFQTVLPSKLFEAMGAARPVILGVEGEAAAVVRAADCGLLIEPEDAAALAAAIQRLEADPDQCLRLGRNGQRLAARRFNRDLLAQRYLAILAALAAGGGRSQPVARPTPLRVRAPHSTPFYARPRSSRMGSFPYSGLRR
jgi:glycosyltransferase involved in cell wall biosynthesis